MNTTYAQKSSTVQKATDTKAASVLDSSAQNESLQRKADMANNAAQRAEAPRPNNTGMPDNLKSGIESLSGFSMDDVRVHYNSSKPATVQALAYTQGTDIHVAPGQEKHLPHEAWHVAQQMAGRVSPTTNINGMPVNDNAALEHEADVMGEKAVQCKKEFSSTVEEVNSCMALQRMSFAADPLAVNTLQWESKGTPWHEKPGLRGENLSKKVDQYKKEMLTCIASKIENHINVINEGIKKGNAAQKNVPKAPLFKCGPHISVVITGGVWYISVNSDANLSGVVFKDSANRVFDELSIQWEKIKNLEINSQEKEKLEGVTNAEVVAKKNDEIRKEAAYIALRWAVSRGKKIQVINNPDTGNATKRVHAEMKILESLRTQKMGWKNREKEERLIKDKLMALGKIYEFNGDKELEKWKRVIRVGGTKIPCFDCFYEMGGKIVIDETESYKVVSLGGYTASYSEIDSQNVEITDAKGDKDNIGILNGVWSRPDTKSKYERKIDSKGRSNFYLCDVFHDEQSYKLTLSQKKGEKLITYTPCSGTFKIKDEKTKMVVLGKVNKNSRNVLVNGEWTLDPESKTRYKCTYNKADYFCDVAPLENPKCHGTLYEKEFGDFSKKNEISSTPCMHDDAGEAVNIDETSSTSCIHDDVGKVVNIGGRNVTTMTSDHSQANNTWCFPGNDTARKADFYEKNGKETNGKETNGKETNGKETLQDQNFDELKKACCAIGVDL